jgi:hypothetical protein
MSGHWEGDNWVTSVHTYSKTGDGQWVDETGKYVATAIPGDFRQGRTQATEGNRRRGRGKGIRNKIPE